MCREWCRTTASGIEDRRGEGGRGDEGGGTETDYDRLHVIKATYHSESIKYRSLLVRWLSPAQPRALMNLSREARAFSPSRSHEEYARFATSLLFTRERERETFRYISLRDTQGGEGGKGISQSRKGACVGHGERSSHVYGEWYNM